MTKIDRTIPPIIRNIGNFSLPTPRKSILDNGISTFCFDNPNLNLIFILLQFKTGSLYQKKKHVCQYMFSLLRESSKCYQPEEMEELLDFYGTNITTNVGIDKVQILISVPKRNIDKILPNICDFLINPSFRDKSLQLFKEKEIKNLAYNEQKTDFLSLRLMWWEFFGKVYPEIFKFSSPNTINNVTIDDLTKFHKDFFCAENTTLFYTGNIDSSTENFIKTSFAAIPHGKKSPELLTISCENERHLVYQNKPNSLQSSLVLASLSLGYNDPERTKFSLLSTLTGGYFGSRLMQNLRERKGFTYGISASSAFFGKQSIFIISSDVNASDTNAAIDACFEELRILQNEPANESELETVKKYITGLNLRSIDTSLNAMQKFALYHHFGLDETEMSRYIAEIKTITTTDTQNIAKKHFDYNKFNKIIVGEYCENN